MLISKLEKALEKSMNNEDTIFEMVKKMVPEANIDPAGNNRKKPAAQ
jgi:hypothetical protein